MDLNSSQEIDKRAAAGKISSTALLLFLPARTLFLIASQGVCALIYQTQGQAAPWQAAAKWWTVWGNLADLGCLALLYMLMKREGLRVKDLNNSFSFQSVLKGFLLFLIAAPATAFGSVLGSWLVYGNWVPDLQGGELYNRVLPQWGTLYTLIIWAPIWSVTEEMTYNAYLTPRIDAVFKRRWLTLLLISFWWALQHSFLPFTLNWQYVAWRFVVFIPCVLTLNLLYMRTRNLTAMVIAHFLLDYVAAVTTLSFV